MNVRRVIVRTLYGGLCTKRQEVVRFSRVNALAVSWGEEIRGFNKWR